MTQLPKQFLQALNAHFDDQTVKIIVDAMESVAPTSIRFNKLKPVKSELEGESIDWCTEGLMLSERPNFGLDPLFHAGAYYVQESSSMFLARILNALQLDQEPIKAADLCAAPGGKTTLLLDNIHPKSTVLANEVDSTRCSILKENLLKWGRSNMIITNSKVEQLSSLISKFDLILLDAPCSGEGMFRKDEFARKQWNEGLVAQCANIQTGLIQEAQRLLKPGGLLIYSTCTLNPIENEQNIDEALKSGFELALPAEFENESVLHPAAHSGNCLGYYLLPGKSTGEGLFFSVLRNSVTHSSRSPKLPKPRLIRLEDYVNQLANPIDFDHYVEHSNQVFGYDGALEFLKEVLASAYVKQIGLPVYEIKKQLLIPNHGLAMDPRSVPDFNLNLMNALEYLRKQNIPADEASIGWKIAGFQGISLGWLKVLEKRINNYYPGSLRLRQ